MAEASIPEVRLNDMVCFNLHAASRAVTAVYRPLLQPLGLTYPQYLVLAVLWEYGDVPVGELVTRLQVDYGTMTPLLKRMEKLNLVHRTRNPRDERSVTVTLAAAGEDLRKEAQGIYRKISETFDFSPQRAEAALSVLRGIVDRVGVPSEEDGTAQHAPDAQG